MSAPLQVTDDPLGPGPQARRTPAAKAAAAKIPAGETEGVFGRVPADLAQRLKIGALRLSGGRDKTTVAELLAVMLAEHVATDEKLQQLGALLDAYRASQGPAR